MSLSELITKVDSCSEDMNAYISPVPNSAEVLDVPIGFLLSSIQRRKDLLLEFLDILCFPGSRIKTLDISVDVRFFSSFIISILFYDQNLKVKGSSKKSSAV